MSSAQGATTPNGGGADRLPGPTPPRGQKDIPSLLVWLLILGWMPVPIFALDDEVSFWRFASIGLLGIGASLLVGALIGFLFGVPKRLQDSTRGPETAYVANTNLEQISDWLTKILVGVSLTQVPGIVGGLERAGKHLAEGAASPGGAPFFSVLTIYYLLTGFFMSYLWTSLQLRSRLEEAEDRWGRLIAAEVAQSPTTQAVLKEAAKEAVVGDLEPKIEDVIDDKDRRDLHARSTVNRQLEPPRGGTRPSNRELRDAIRNGSDTARYEIFEKARTFRRRADGKADGATRRARGEVIVPIFEALIDADAEKKFHRNYAQLGFALKLTERWAEVEAALDSAIEIRDSQGDRGYPLYELNRALARIELGASFEARAGGVETARSMILDDLKTAARSSDLFQRLRDRDASNKQILDWLEAQGIEVMTLAEDVAKG